MFGHVMILCLKLLLMRHILLILMESPTIVMSETFLGFYLRMLFVLLKTRKWINDYVEDYFKADFWRKLYAYLIYHVPNISLFPDQLDKDVHILLPVE